MRNSPALGGREKIPIIELFERDYRFLNEFSTEFFGVTLEFLCEVPAFDVLEARVILDDLGVEQLATREATLEELLSVQGQVQGVVEPARRAVVALECGGGSASGVISVTGGKL